MEKGFVININAQGIVVDNFKCESRNAKDGYVYFGYLDNQDIIDKVKYYL